MGVHEGAGEAWCASRICDRAMSGDFDLATWGLSPDFVGVEAKGRGGIGIRVELGVGVGARIRFGVRFSVGSRGRAEPVDQGCR